MTNGFCQLISLVRNASSWDSHLPQPLIRTHWLRNCRSPNPNSWGYVSLAHKARTTIKTSQQKTRSSSMVYFHDAVRSAIDCGVPCARPYSGIKLLQLIRKGDVHVNNYFTGTRVIGNPGCNSDTLITRTDDVNTKTELERIVNNATSMNIASLDEEKAASLKASFCESISLGGVKASLTMIKEESWRITFGNGVVTKKCVPEFDLEKLLSNSNINIGIEHIKGVITAIYCITGGLIFTGEAKAATDGGAQFAEIPNVQGWSCAFTKSGGIKLTEENPIEWVIAIEYCPLEYGQVQLGSDQKVDAGSGVDGSTVGNDPMVDSGSVCNVMQATDPPTIASCKTCDSLCLIDKQATGEQDDDVCQKCKSKRTKSGQTVGVYSNRKSKQTKSGQVIGECSKYSSTGRVNNKVDAGSASKVKQTKDPSLACGSSGRNKLTPITRRILLKLPAVTMDKTQGEIAFLADSSLLEFMPSKGQITGKRLRGREDSSLLENMHPKGQTTGTRLRGLEDIIFIGDSSVLASKSSFHEKLDDHRRFFD